MKLTRPISKDRRTGAGDLFLHRTISSLAVIGVVCLLMMILLILPTSQARALPEYSVQTGEPCATCHISPSGGGPRGPRGQAWVGEGKPGAVPGLIEALESLGVHLDVDETYFQATSESVEPARPLELSPVEAEKLLDWLNDYDGN